jgi:hypothetical protein
MPGDAAPAIAVESPVRQNKKCRSIEEAIGMSHRSAQAFCFANRLETRWQASGLTGELV